MNNRNRSHISHSETLYRPVFEINSAFVYICAGIATAILSRVSSSNFSVSAVVSLGLLFVGLVQLSNAIPKIRKQLKLFVNSLLFISILNLRKVNNAAFNSIPANFHVTDKRNIYLGEGFEWGPEQAQRAYQILDLSIDLREMALPFAFKPIVKSLNKGTKKLGGRPWIHGLGQSHSLLISEDNFFGHTFITGNVGTGKTVILRALGTGFLHLGHSLIVIDPKDDHNLKEGLRAEAKHLGIEDKFYEFCPARPSQSCAIDILKNFATPSEIPTRIAGLLKGNKSGSDNFVDFGWQTISQVVDGMIYCSEAPRLSEIYRYMRTGKAELLRKVLERFFSKYLGKYWKEDYLQKMSEMGDSELSGMLAYYNENVPSKDKVPAVDDVIQYVTHNQEHAQKMLTSVFPLFKVLCSNPLDKLLSPVRGETENPVIDIKRVIQDGGIIYCSLNSMSDPKTAGNLAKLILADVAGCLGDRYNYGNGKERRVSILVDEVHAAVAGNESLLNNLAQGRAAQAQFVLATQTIPDLIDMTDEATAERYLGLCNSFITCRVTDMKTQEYVAQQFNKTSIRDVGVQYSVQTATNMGLTDFSGGYKENVTKSREDMFPPGLIGDLPKLQFMARLSNGQKLKGKLAIINDGKGN